jgi:hypothetical protein
MKNITVSIDDETYRKARVYAAANDTSISAIVKAYLAKLDVEGKDLQRLREEGRKLRAQIKSFNGADRLPREQIYDRTGRK